MIPDYLQRLLPVQPYSLSPSDKEALMLEGLRWLDNHHCQNSPIYASVRENVFTASISRLEDVPFIPISMFKTHEMRSIPPEQVFKKLTSSGTGGASVSSVYLDAETAQLQARVLVRLGQHFLGKERGPMVIVDSPAVHRQRNEPSARSAAILGMLQFARKPFYCLREDTSLDVEGLEAYLADNEGRPVAFFGFTFMIWQHLLKPLQDRPLRLGPGCKLFHSGGWKRLQDISVDAEQFRRTVQASTGIEQVRSFYAMAEQVGSVFFENELGYLHASEFSEIIIRDPITLRPLPLGQVGLIQVISLLPLSYPGFSILTEDLGAVQGEGSAQLQGRYFYMQGRVPKAQLRGCSDTYQVDAPAIAAQTQSLPELPESTCSRAFEPTRVGAMAELSRQLLATRPGPAVTALAFWLRRANLARLEADFRELERSSSAALVPSGRVFHLAPANVDTLFVYSWALAYLCGNASVVRVSGRSSGIVGKLLDELKTWMDKDPGVRGENRFITYEHDDEITAAISEWCSLRVVWGGNDAVRQIRRIELNPQSNERLFASKFSYAVFSASAYLGLEPCARERLVHDLANDVFWFDGRGCSSPQAIFWLGERAQEARSLLELDLECELKQHPVELPSSLGLERTSLAFGLAASGLAQVRLGNTALHLTMVGLPTRETCGGGLLQHAWARLPEIVSFAREEDQTLVHFGLSEVELEELARGAGLRGLDRLVPVGQALAFEANWDGYSLMTDFTRKVVIRK